MDVNRTRFHLLTGPDDWEPRLDAAAALGLWWDREQASLSLLPRVLRFAPRASEALLTPAQRRGAACDAYGNIYWIDAAARRVRLLPAATTVAGDYWGVADLQSTRAPTAGAFAPVAAEPVSPPQLRGLVVTREHYLVVGTLDPGGLLVFDLHGGGPPTSAALADAGAIRAVRSCVRARRRSVGARARRDGAEPVASRPLLPRGTARCGTGSGERRAAGIRATRRHPCTTRAHGLPRRARTRDRLADRTRRSDCRRGSAGRLGACARGERRRRLAR
ncbi:MAG: hypothetical protein MZW92_40860 [Comamonadaceae bacterium]|nr:hypothetical protein [Comamonadaceae bacterium]